MALAGIASLLPPHALASEFSVSPIRAELKSGALSETITVTNESQTQLRVAIKLMEWTQNDSGEDVYKESSDLIYFPRQLELAAGTKRLVRVGARKPASETERTYRLFIEEMPEAASAGAPAAVTFYFRFGVPIFLPPGIGKPLPEAAEPTLAKGRLSVAVKNAGNQHFRLHRLIVTDGAGYTQEIAGWYSLAASTRTYTVSVPPETCRNAKTLSVKLVGEGITLDRTLNVDPTRCS